MRTFIKQLWRRFNSPAEPRQTRRSFRRCLLVAEELECRIVPTVIFNSQFGGDTITQSSPNGNSQTVTSPITNNPYALNDPPVYLIFWGPSWTSSTAQQFANDAQTIINSSYLSGLRDYGADGTATFGGYYIDNSTPTAGSPPVAATSEINNIVPNQSTWAKPTQGASPAGSAFWPGIATAPIYVVVFDNYSGSAGNGPDAYLPNGPNLAMNHIWIGDAGNNEDSFTDLFSHELVERISSGGGGISMNASTNISGEYQNAQIADNEPDGGRYTYRLDGSVLVQAYWSLTYQAFVVPDGNTQTLTLNPVWVGTSFKNNYGQLAVEDNQLGPDSNITMYVTSGGGVGITLNGEDFQFDNGRIPSVVISGEANFANINIQQTVVPVIVTDAGNAAVTVGLDGSLQNIKGQVQVADPEHATVTVDDSTDANYESAVYVGEGYVEGLSPADITFDSLTVDGLTVLAGPGGANITVSGTPWHPSLIPPTTTINTGAGSDTINVLGTEGPLVIDGNKSLDTQIITIGSKAPSLGGTLANIQGTVTVTNTSANSTLTVDDSGDSTSRTATISDSTITGLAPTTIFYNGNQLASLTVLGGTAHNTFNVTGTSTNTTLFPGTNFLETVNVQATSAALTINGDGRIDTITVGSLAPSLGGTLTNIQGPITVTNTSAWSTLSVDDSGDETARTGTIGISSITGFGMGSNAAINYTGSQLLSLTVRGGHGQNTITVTGTSTNTTLQPGTNLLETVNVQETLSPLTINGDNESDTINVGSQAPSLGGNLAYIQAPITLVNMSTSSTLSVDDTGDSVARSGTISGTSITGFGMASGAGINYAGTQLSSITVRCGTGKNTIAVTNTSANTVLYPGGSLGNEAAASSSTVNVQGTTKPLTINGAGIPDVVNVGSLAPNLGGTLASIRGTITIQGGGEATNAEFGTTSLNVDDSGDNSVRSGVISPTSVTGLDMGANAQIAFGVNALLNLTVRVGTNTTLDLSGTSATTTLVGASPERSFRSLRPKRLSSIASKSEIELRTDAISSSIA